MVRGIRIDLDEPALLIADTHIGIEVDLARRGVRVVSQVDKLAGSVVEWGEELGATWLIVLGDVKHEYSTVEIVAREIRRFVDIIRRGFNRVTLVVGNHDGGLQELAKDLGVEVVGSRGFVVEVGGRRTLLLHGHAKPEREHVESVDVIVMGHHHPSVSLRDNVGYVARVPALVKIKTDKDLLCGKLGYGSCSGKVSIIVLPASHPLISGTDVSMMPIAAREMRSLLNYVPREAIEEGEVYMTDMTFLGSIKDFTRVEEIDYDFEK